MVRPSGKMMSPKALPYPLRFLAYALEVIAGLVISAGFCKEVWRVGPAQPRIFFDL